MWTITDLDYESPLFANAEAREGAGVSPTLWAKWNERGLLVAPSRVPKGGRGGQYSAKQIFELRVINVVVEETAIPVSEARQIAKLAAQGEWNVKELATNAPKNWRSYVLRERHPPLNIFLIFSKTDDCWGCKPSIGPPRDEVFKNSASLALAAARELTGVSKYCWGLLRGSDEQATGRHR